MRESDQIILQLLRKALNPDCPVDNSLFRDVDWEEVMDVAFEGVWAVVYWPVGDIDIYLKAES